jgi:hypothetical protein
MPAPTLDGRLLCASGAAYAIIGTETMLAPDPTNVYMAGAGFVRPPAVIVAGASEIDGCLVGEIDDGIVIAFRGTLPFDLQQVPTLLDWLNDFDADPLAVAGWPGKVHSGFANAFRGLSARIADQLAAQRLGSLLDKPVFATGHSKGGAMATLFAWQVKQQGIPVEVVTFAAARAGDSDFRTAYAAAGIIHTRYEYDDDIVPHLPPSQDGLLSVLSSLPLIGDRFAVLKRFDYRPVGALKYIDETGRIVADDETLRAERNLALAMEVVLGRFPQIASDHSIGCGSGYMTAVAPSGVCPA